MIKSLLALMLVGMVGAAHATQEKNTLVLERISITQNGSSSGNSIASHAMMQRLGSQENCLSAALLLNGKETRIVIDNKNVFTETLASCIAVDYSVQY